MESLQQLRDYLSSSKSSFCSSVESDSVIGAAFTAISGASGRGASRGISPISIGVGIMPTGGKGGGNVGGGKALVCGGKGGGGGGETGFGGGGGEVIAVGGGGEVGVEDRGGDIGAGAEVGSGLVLVLFMASVVISSGGGMFDSSSTVDSSFWFVVVIGGPMVCWVSIGAVCCII